MEMISVEVQIRHKCRHCERGFVANDAWVEIRKAEEDLEKKKGQPITNEEFDQIMVDFGYNPDPKYWPPEEFECEYCGGTMIEKRWIKLEELQNMLRYFG